MKPFRKKNPFYHKTFIVNFDETFHGKMFKHQKMCDNKNQRQRKEKRQKGKAK